MSKPRYDWWPYEQWRDIDGYNGKYQVSDLGRVRSFAKDKDGLILKQQRKKTGYMCVNLYAGKCMKTKLVHRLVASAFLQDKEINAAQVNHIDENKENNLTSNLEVISAKENANHGTRNKRIVENSDRKLAALHLCKSVIQLSESGLPIRSFPSIKEAARELNINNGQISNCCAGKKRTAGGFQWRAVNE